MDLCKHIDLRAGAFSACGYIRSSLSHSFIATETQINTLCPICFIAFRVHFKTGNPFWFQSISLEDFEKYKLLCCTLVYMEIVWEGSITLINGLSGVHY